MDKQIVSVFDDFFGKNNRFIGFNDFFKDAFESNMIGNQTFPPYNIYKKLVDVAGGKDENITEEHTFFEIALAGFRKEHIRPVFNKKTHVLKISGENTDQIPEGLKYIHKGIAGRSFELSWKLQPNLELFSSKYEDGIFTVEFREVLDSDAESEIVLL